MGSLTLGQKTVILIIANLCAFTSIASAVSQWDPFCTEETVFTPYVRVFQKGRHGVLLRDRGPGFIDVNGLQDIYVCTNGLVMLYYTKTKGMGEVFERGELHWAPHHCQLYNPSCTGIGIDQPRRNLMSILLIGHPKDYRRPALQMFVAPTFDVAYGKYINITSLLMIGADGECLIEKGVERARLRIRLKEPGAAAAAAGAAPAPATPTGPTEKPPIFCQLDSQRKLGQKSIITLASDEKMVAEKKSGFDEEGVPISRTNVKNEMGSLINPRFRASKVGTPPDPKLAQVADEVYALLLNDRKMRFVGCLSYPDFNVEQQLIIEDIKGLVNNKTLFEVDEDKTLVPDATHTFWGAEMLPAWAVPGDAAAKPEKRSKTYADDDWKKPEPTYKTIAEEVKKASEALDAAKAVSPPKQEDIVKAEAALNEQKIKLSLWPLLQTYKDIHNYLIDLQLKLIEAWNAVYDMMSKDPAGTTGAKSPNVTAHLYHDSLKSLSESKWDHRYEAYDPKFIIQNANFTNLTKEYHKQLREHSAALGPLIATAETLYTRHRVYKGLLKKALTDLETAVKQVEKSRMPIGQTLIANPFDRYFVDTEIVIADAGGGAAAAGAPAASTTPNSNGKACFELTTLTETCKAIKPKAVRACELLKCRMGKGAPFDSPHEWRQKVLDLLESVFKNACPYISDEFAIAINRIIRGYLKTQPLGTGLDDPINGTRLKVANHKYQMTVYNKTYQDMNYTNEYKGDLRPKDPFWEIIISALEDCASRTSPMEFWHNEEGDRPVYISFRKFFRNNKTDMHYDVEDLFMQEKADLEYAFNWAVDMNWRIFATVLGICMPNYETKIPLISARFYALYTQDFLYPLRQIWMSNRDNPILKTILGSYYGTGKGDRWSRICMESSFVESGDRSYRPPRGLYVNAFTEMNYFTTGPLAGTSGRLTGML